MKSGNYGSVRKHVASYLNKGHSISWIARKVGTSRQYVRHVINTLRAEDVSEKDFNDLVAAFTTSPQPDMVNSPPHYTVGGIEVIDFIEAKLSPEEFRGYLKGNLIKYLSRASYKGEEEQDAGKVRWYSDRLEKSYKKNQ